MISSKIINVTRKPISNKIIILLANPKGELLNLARMSLALKSQIRVPSKRIANGHKSHMTQRVVVDQRKKN